MGVVDAISSIITTYYPWYEDIIEKANINIPTREYVYRAVRVTLALSITTLSLSLVYLLSFIPSPYSELFSRFIIFAPLSILIFLISMGGFIAYPFIRKVSLASKLEANLISLVAFMYSLSASGADLDEVFTRIVESFGPDEAFPFSQYLHYRNVLGWDVTKALKRVADRCPNEELANIFSMLSYSVVVSEDFTPVIETLYNRLLEIRRLNFEKKVNSLTFLSEIFISSMVVLPVMVITILIIISMVGSSIFGLDPALLTSLVVFLLIPMSAVFIIVTSVGE